MKHLKLFLVTISFALLSACSLIGSAAPDTFNQRLAVAAASVTEVRHTATTLFQSNKISVADAKNIEAQADVAREGLNIARGMSGVDLNAANTRLDVVNTALKALQAYLITKQGISK